MSKEKVYQIPTMKIFIGLLITKFFDIITTYYSIFVGSGYEGNPITAYIMNTWGFNMWVIISLIIMIGVGIILSAVQTILREYDLPPKYVMYGYYSIYGCIFLNILVVINNFYIILIGF